jgi:two-component system alkaline phosphatase synthesis response regulator PhoP
MAAKQYKASLLIAEDEESLREALKLNMELEGYEVTTVDNGPAVIKAVKNEYFDLIILDIMLPDMDGITVCETIRMQHNDVPILFLSARNSGADRVEGLRKGGDDYLTKPFSAEELQLRVKALLKRVKLQPENPEQKVVKIGLYTFDTENFTLQSPSQLLTLTKKEAMILRTLYKFKNQLIPRDVILNSVWGQDDYFVGRSLDVFITKLRKYLKEDTSIQINNVHGVGFKFECQE